MGDLPGGMFSHDIQCLIPDGRPTLHRSKPISLRSTPKEHPPLVTQLTQYRIATAAIVAFNVTVVPVTPEHLLIAQQHCAQHGLLTNDALMSAVMYTLGLADLASNDPDLMLIPGLTIWQPQPQRGSITNTS